MVLEAIIIGTIGVTYLAGNEDRKKKMKNIGTEIIDVSKDGLSQLVNATENIVTSAKKNIRSKK